MKNLEQIDEAELSVFKKKLRKLQEFKGRGTELISLYLPPNTDRGNVTSQLTEEMSQSANIKSPSTKKNVQGALRRIQAFLKQIDFRLPQKGIVLFCGNVSEHEGKTDIQFFTIKPPLTLKTKLYWCDSEFHLAPLKEMAQPREIFGIVSIDKNEATIAVIVGKRYEILGKFTSGVAGKHRAGGQCLSPDSLIQLSNGEIIQIKNAHNPLTVKSFDFEKKELRESKITSKWETKKQLIRIITKKPRTEINCSEDHTFFTLRNSAIIELPASSLQENDILLMPEKIKTTPSEVVIQPLQYHDSFIINEEGAGKIINSGKKLGLSQEKLGRLWGQRQATISALELQKFNPRKENLQKICKLLEIDFSDFIQKYCDSNSVITLPTRVDEKLAQIIGYFLGGGNFENERIAFSENNEEVAKKYESLIRACFNCNTTVKHRENKGYYQIRAYGKPIVELFRNEFPELKKSNDSLIPAKILKSNDKTLAAFLRGLFDAEGFAVKHRIGLGVNNKLLAQQLQLTFLRFGIIASLHEYDNRANIYSDNPRHIIDIGEKESMEMFRDKIGFTYQKKQEKLEKAINGKTSKNRVRQMLFEGSKIREIIEKHGYNMQRFPKATNFFRNERKMSKIVFKNSILNYVKDKKLLAELEKIHEYPVIPAEIALIQKTNSVQEMVDISVENQNFVANGLIVHNSAARFERLREEATHEFYKRISEKVNQAFLEYGEKLGGIIVGGPGMTKNYFIETELVDYRLRKKIIGTLDTSYTDESGIREIVQKSDELLKDTEIVREKTALNEFMTEIAKDALATFGQKNVEEALRIGKVKALLLSEAIEWMVHKVKCNACGNEQELVARQPRQFELARVSCSKCQSSKQIEVIEEIDYIDWMIEKAQATAAETKIISTETPEGEQFLKAFDGIGALLRYK